MWNATFECYVAACKRGSWLLLKVFKAFAFWRNAIWLKGYFAWKTLSVTQVHKNITFYKRGLEVVSKDAVPV